MLLGHHIYARPLGRAGPVMISVLRAQPLLLGGPGNPRILPVLHQSYTAIHKLRSVNISYPIVYDAFAFNDLTNSRARVGLVYERISRPSASAHWS